MTNTSRMTRKIRLIKLTKLKTTRYLLFISLIMPALALAWPWSQDMMNQPSI